MTVTTVYANGANAATISGETGWSNVTYLDGTSQTTNFATAATARNTYYGNDFRGLDFSAVPDGATISTVTVYAWTKETGTANVTYRGQFYDGATAIGTQFTTGAIAGSTTAVRRNVSPTGTLPTVAQLKSGTFGYRFEATRTSTTANTESAAYIEVNVTWALNATATPAVLAAPASFPAPVVRQDRMITATALAAPAAFPAATVVVPVDSPPLEVSGFGTFTGPGSGDTINSVTVRIGQFASSALMEAPTFELWDGTSARIGDVQTGTASTDSAHMDTASITGVSYAQLGTLRVRIRAHSGTAGPGATLSVDWVSLTVAYTPATGDATVTPGVLAAPVSLPFDTASSSVSIELVADYAVTAPVTFPAPVVRQDAWPAPAALAAPASFPAATVTAGGSATATPAALAAPASFPAPVVRQDRVIAGAVLAAPASFPAAGAHGSAGVSPAVLTAPAAFPAATAHQDAAASPAVLAVPAAFPAPGVTAGGNATVTPAVLAAPASFPQPGVAAGGGVTATPAVLACPAAFGQPVVRQDIRATPAVLAAPAAFPAAAVHVSAYPAPAALALAAAFPAVLVRQDQRILVLVLAAPAVFPAPVVARQAVFGTAAQDGGPAVRSTASGGPAATVSHNGRVLTTANAKGVP